MVMRGRALVALAVSVGFVTACESSTDVGINYVASLNGANERPTAVTTTATGTFNATLEGDVLSYTLTFGGLTSNSNGAHIHGPATTAQAIGVLVDFSAAGATPPRIITLGSTGGTASGSVILNAATSHTATVNGDSLRKLLDLGLLYVNVHSVN